MTTLIDVHGATVTTSGDGFYYRDGVTVEAASDAAALTVFAGMAPEGWTPPPIPTIVPQTVDMWKIRYVLAQHPAKAGSTNPNLLHDANVAVAALGGALEIFWEYAAVLNRTDSNLMTIAAALDMTAAAIDALFVAAAAVGI